MSGLLVAFEGLDQSGKQTQAELLRDRLKEQGHKSRLVSFPDYGTSIGEEIARLKLETMGVEIDKLTEEQEKYLASWDEGT